MIVTHKPVEFEPIGVYQPSKLAVGSFGLSGSGKSAFFCTMPGKTGIVTLDDKTKPIVEKRAAELGIKNGKILFPKGQDYIRYEHPLKVAQMSIDDSIRFYSDLKIRILDAIYTLVERTDVSSIGFDGGMQMSELCLLANYGRLRRIMPRDRGPYNEDMANFFNALRTKNCVITHKASEIWEGPEEKRRPSGRYEWKGHGELDYFMDCVIEHTYDEVEKEWYLSINRSNPRPDLIGAPGYHLLNGAMVRFDALFLQLWPNAELPV